MKKQVCIIEENLNKYLIEYLESLGIEIRLYPCKINKGEEE
jgi:hypothetical protein